MNVRSPSSYLNYSIDNIAHGTGLDLATQVSTQTELIALLFDRNCFVHCSFQVLSETVAKALELTGGPEVRETARFVRTLDKFFDCVNELYYL